MNPLEQWDNKRILIYEIGIRIVCVGVVIVLLNHVFFADVNGYLIRARHISVDYLPYRDFLWEYPPVATLPLLLIPITGRTLSGFFPLFVAISAGMEYAALRMIRKQQPEHAWSITKFWMLAVFPVAMVAWFRLDMIPMFCATIAMLAMIRGRTSAAAVVVGFGAKLWPIVFVGPMVLRRQWKSAAISVVGSLAIVGAWHWYSPAGFDQFMEFRRGSGFQVESIPGSLLLLGGRFPDFLFGALVVSDDGWEWVQTLLNVLLFVVPGSLFVAAWLRRDRVDVVALSGAFVLGLILTTRLLSPQFLIWVAPFVAWLWPRYRSVGYTYGVAAWFTWLVIENYQTYLLGNKFLQFVGVLRNVALLALFVLLVRAALFPKSEHARVESVESGSTEISA